MLDFLKDRFRKDKPRGALVCNQCGFIWHPQNREKLRSMGGLCPDCGGADTELRTDWHRANPDKMRERLERYVKSQEETSLLCSPDCGEMK
jgi:hypothetical protein